MGTMRRGAAAMAVGLTLGAATLATGPAPVAAAPTESDTLVFAGYDSDTWILARNGEQSTASALEVDIDPIPGDFSAAPGTDLFVYGAGSEPDGVVHVDPTGTGASASFTPMSVNGRYQPLAGDYDGDDLTDILWYAPGTAPDSIWLFRPDGTHVSVPTSISGDYAPIVVEATGDGHDDILWYAPGTGADSLWVFGAGASHQNRAVRVDGYYEPFVAHLRDTPAGRSQEQIVWYDRLGPDSMWTFTAGGHTFRSLPDVDNALPIVGDLLATGRDVIFWYRPGRSWEVLTTVAADGTPSARPAPGVDGAYTPVVGDFDGDDHEEIAWTREGTAFTWTLHGDGSRTQTSVATGHKSSVGAVARTDPADL